MTELTLEKGSKIVYPAHGVGTIKGVIKQKIAGTDMSVYEMDFEKDKMTLKIPVSRAEKSGLRELSSIPELAKVKKTLKGKCRVSRGMWSKRAKEYESKINSGNIILLAEVVRDLHKNVDDPDRSYSERIIYENAINRLAGEFAAVYEVEHNSALEDIVECIVSVNKPKPADNVTPLVPELDEIDEFAEFDEDEDFEEEVAA